MRLSKKEIMECLLNNYLRKDGGGASLIKILNNKLLIVQVIPNKIHQILSHYSQVKRKK